MRYLQGTLQALAYDARGIHMVQQIKVLVTGRFNDAQLNRLKSVSPRLVIELKPVVTPWSRTDTSDLFEGDEEIFYGFMPPNNLSKASHLKWVQLYSAGANQLTDHPIMLTDIPITTASGTATVPMGEFAVMMMLTLARHVPRMVRMQDDGEWPEDRLKALAGSELRGKTLGIVGYGSIGREVARIAKQGFNMRILALTRTGRKEDSGYVEEGVGDPDGRLPEVWFLPNQLRELLSQSDFVVISTPLTNETRDLIGKAELRAMKPTAYLINTARGAIINEQALEQALKEHWIAGAGLDVFTVEPLPPTSELWKLENTLITPHVSANSPNYEDRAANLFAENVKRYLNREPLLNLFDRRRGY